ncbi:MAG: ATP-binding cassette domain-containing protein [Spirochaetales bacterium]|nr:ATP-binding cassette domain-containing protein [Spirochaetales bacterium]
MPEIQCSHVTFSYREGVPVLSDVSCRIPQGQYAAIVGANGSGKSTFIRHLNGLLVPRQGEVRVGVLTSSKKQDIIPLRTTVGMVFQSPESQIVGTTVETDIAFALENTGVSRNEIRSRIRRVLNETGLSGFETRPTDQLSAGEQQKLAIACMMALHPDIIVFDEATSMIEPEGRKEILSLIRALHAQGKTVICVTHDMDEALEAERILHFHRGVLLHDLPPSDFFSGENLLEFNIGYPSLQTAARRLAGYLPGFDLSHGTLDTLKDSLAAGIKRAKTPAASEQGINEETENKETVIHFDTCSFSYLHGTERSLPGLDKVSTEIAAGECVGIIGSTGSGKSTLLQHIDALLIPQKGAVSVFSCITSDTHTDLRALRVRIGFAFQKPEKQLFRTFTGDDIAFGLEQLGLPLTEQARLVRNAMKKTGLSYMEFKDRPVHGLSGGEKRKAALSGVLVTNPEILLLDEPTSGLDPAARQDIIGLVKKEKSAGSTVVFITHDMEVLCALADRVIAMEKGGIGFDGPLDEFMETRYGGGNPDGEESLPVAARISLDPRFRGLNAWSLETLGARLGEGL